MRGDFKSLVQNGRVSRKMDMVELGVFGEGKESSCRHKVPVLHTKDLTCPGEHPAPRTGTHSKVVGSTLIKKWPSP